MEVLSPVTNVAMELLANMERYQGDEPHTEELTTLNRLYTVVVTVWTV